MDEKYNSLSTDSRGLETLNDIKRLMEKSSRFISLSGWSGIAAGICALVGVYITTLILGSWEIDNSFFKSLSQVNGISLRNQLFEVGGGTFVIAFSLAFLFTWLRSKKTNVPVWGPVARRLMYSVAGVIIVGSLFLYRMIQIKQYELIAPGCLLFYGLALVNASKYTLGEVRYLGYGEVLLGLISCWMIRYGIYFWATGFGVFHIIYGIIMWTKYERKQQDK